ncbi:hypothetical protein ACVMB3_001711 [Sinorhizobium meliloti]|jgi:hypothetical protein|uniref:Uncharacterized protein n=1 Tax=Sinorhizobium meliloti CCNWSX0020 TaxID=1107881 RepID=H0G364_RHIML|nr:hypothetical protein SinmeB_2912 [Sinorhizobium meliloti BL225C]AEG54845.1 hypothetical protein Sinme_3138 [Sinorhizobium meliloti AK83]AGA08112.1 hypothetical protein C770_GR4Chr3223 [Sinorhizobium meliloti GR4]EHK76227.1 hypothetical protein SM0020_19552 [Sinorhizobium meliloti CCNWSX0020]MBP2465480.1 hypothetical protein [Sinorhizobium meliloti]PII38304.1 hypothetical protein T190_22600 [Sinorhizobium meliloti CCBAU 01290]TWA96830.1 hypothetical protein FB000_11523 [Ensifer sp. SEMIA 13
MPLTLTLSPQAGRGDEFAASFFNIPRFGASGRVLSLLPACGEKVAAAG